MADGWRIVRPFATPGATPGRPCPVVGDKPGHRDAEAIGDPPELGEPHARLARLGALDGISADAGSGDQGILREVAVCTQNSETITEGLAALA
jgi:hypothetical protein